MTVSNSTNTDLNPAVLSDGAGGLFAAWQDCPNEGSNCDIAMQHLDSNGQTTWSASQIFVSREPNQQLAPALQPNGSGGVVAMWTDCRNYPDANSCYANSDVYAQDLDTSNNLWEPNGYPLLADQGNRGRSTMSIRQCPQSSRFLSSRETSSWHGRTVGTMSVL